MKICEPLITPRRVFLFFLLLLVFLGSIFPITDNDVWWHLKTGQIIFQNRAIPTRDIFSFTIFGKPWIAFEWLSQFVLYMVYKVSGLSGVVLFKAVVVSFIFLLMGMRSRKANSFMVWTLFAAGFVALREGLQPRPQLFTYLFVALFLVILSVRDRKWWLAIPFLEIVWVNMHGPAAIIGVGITALYASFRANEKPLRRLALVILTTAAIFISPQTFHIFTYFFRFFHEGFNELILEYQSPQFSITFIPYFAILIITLFASRRIFKREPVMLPLLVLSGVASLLAIRNIPVFIILAAPICADAIQLPTTFEIRKTYQAFSFGVAFFLLFGFISMKFDVLNRFRFGVSDRYPARYAVDFIRKNHVPGNMFNDYDYGGYLIWKLYPENKVFVDGRLVEYGAEFVKKSFYYWKPEIWEEFEKGYDITAAILPQESYYNARYLDSRSDWVLVWWDDATLIYLKRVKKNDDFIRRFGYRFLKPNSPDQRQLKGLPRASVLSELGRAISSSPQSSRARLLRDYVMEPGFCNRTRNSTNDAGLFLPQKVRP